MISNPVIKRPHCPDPIPFFNAVTREEFWNFCCQAFDIYEQRQAFTKTCVNCGKFSLWVNNEMVWPQPNGIPPHEQMPKTVKKVFKEAQAIHSRSPRAACALLRAAAERLVDYVSPDSKGVLANRIAELEISPRCKQILTVARLIGNEAVHGNEVDFSESNEEALARVQAISKGLNQVVDELIAQPAELKAIETQMRNARKR